MKIAIFTDTFLPQINGIVTSVINLAKGLADRGHKIYIIAPIFNKKSEEFKYKNIEVKRTHSVPALFYEDFKFTLPLSPRVTKFLIKKKIDLIHFHTPITLGMEAVLLAKILRVPLVGTFHTFFTDPQYLKHAKLNNPLFEKIAWTYSNGFYKKCDLVTTPSVATKKELIKQNCKCKKEIKVISNGIYLDKFDNSKSKRIKKEYKKEGKFFLFVGRIAHEKNVFFLLDSFRPVIKQEPKTKLLIVGDGPQFKKLKRKVNEYSLEKNIMLLGKIPHKKLIKSGIYGACDAFITASKTENQPMTVLEAQANGLVCIGLNKRGIPDLIKNNINGFTTEEKEKEFSEAILKVIRDDKLVKKMKKATLKEIENHKMSKIIDTWEENYKNLIKEKRETKDLLDLSQ